MKANKVEIIVFKTLIFVTANGVDKAAFFLDQMNHAELFATQLVHEAYAEHKRQNAIFRRSPSTWNSFVANFAPELWGKLCA